MKKLFTPLSVAMYLLLFQNMAICAPVASCDTITNITSRDTLIYYLNDSAQGGGYLSGNNGYGDEEKAEELSGPVGSQLTGAFIGFGYINYNPAILVARLQSMPTMPPVPEEAPVQLLQLLQ
jgi:hypothetical protein